MTGQISPSLVLTTLPQGVTKPRFSQFSRRALTAPLLPRADKLTSFACRRMSLPSRKVAAYAHNQYNSFDWFEGGPEPEDEGPPEKVFTYFTSDGVVQLREPMKSGLPGEMRGGPVPPRRRPRPQQEPLPSLEDQGICIASTFKLAATNGHDLSRRIIWHGYARSASMLADAVEDIVLWHGGLVAVRECRTVETFTSVLDMTIVYPRLWSTRTPELDTLSYAIAEGGGIIEGVKQQWHII